jgi:hypothetical protein
MCGNLVDSLGLVNVKVTNPLNKRVRPRGAKLADFGLEIDALLYVDATKYVTWSSFPSAFLWQNHRSIARPAQVGSEVAQGSAFRGR